jgi:hypothetical protein
MGASALHNVGNIQQAADNGDWRAADRMLQTNPVARDDFATKQGSGFGSISVSFNISRAAPEEIKQAHKIIDVTPG